jgi:predicted RNA binding protein YcfA (HicA-like mRNA interferase family)
LLRNKPVKDVERALLRDGFALIRQTGTGSRFYSNPDGRRTVIHFHRGSDTLPLGTLGAVLAATRWTEEDARRLGLL